MHIQVEREQKLQEKQVKENNEAKAAVTKEGIISNDEEFYCPICYTLIKIGEGIRLRNCLHQCCKCVKTYTYVYIPIYGTNSPNSLLVLKAKVCT